MTVDPELLLAEFGARLRRARMAAGYSQEELAHRAGLDRTYVSGVERGVRNASLVNVCRLAAAAGVDAAALVAGLAIEAPDNM